jgi:hypothetical protein
LKIGIFCSWFTNYLWFYDAEKKNVMKGWKMLRIYLYLIAISHTFTFASIKDIMAGEIG